MSILTVETTTMMEKMPTYIDDFGNGGIDLEDITLRGMTNMMMII